MIITGLRAWPSVCRWRQGREGCDAPIIAVDDRNNPHNARALQVFGGVKLYCLDVAANEAHLHVDHQDPVARGADDEAAAW